MNIVMPLIILVVLKTALIKKVDIVSAFCEGARENLITAFELCPTLILLMTAIGMFTSSGASDGLSSLLEPLTSFLGFPSECTALMLVRPISGSGSLAVLENILSSNPADSFASRTACVMMGATETTLYTIAIYFAAVSVKPQIRVFISSFSADFAGLLFASIITKIYFG
ncbi:MAG: spore maturation protein [Ruminococcus sp.]|nr:spore maturation protein [Ruminococcus sp.]